jgi:hypothetical protein
LAWPGGVVQTTDAVLFGRAGSRPGVAGAVLLALATFILAALSIAS